MENPFQIINEKLDFIISEFKRISEIIKHNEPHKANITKREAANELLCSIPMIDKLLQSGRLEKIKVGAKVLIPRSSIDKILKSKK